MNWKVLKQAINVYHPVLSIWTVNLSKVPQVSFLQNIVRNSRISFQLSDFKHNFGQFYLYGLGRKWCFYQSHNSLPLDQGTERNSHNYFIFAGFKNKVVVSELSFEKNSFFCEAICNDDSDSLNIINSIIFLNS